MRRVRLLLAAGLVLAPAARSAADEATANRLYVEAIQGLAGVHAEPDAEVRQARLAAAAATLARILDEHPGSAAALRAVDLLHPEAVRALADAVGTAVARGPDADTLIAARAAAVPALARLTVCTAAAPTGCLRAAATAKLLDLGLLDEADGGQAAALAALDVVERVALGLDLDVAGEPWPRQTAVYAALDLWSEVAGVASLAPWQAVSPERLPEDLGGSLAALTAFLADREAQADRELAAIRDAACAADPAPDAAALAPALCGASPTFQDLDALWQGLAPYRRLGALEILGQAHRQAGRLRPWAAFLYGLERPTDLAPEEAPFLARALIGGAIAWRVAEFR